MNTAIVMLGSNINSTENIKIAIEKLAVDFKIEAQSLELITKPVEEKYKKDFLNIAIKLLTTKPKADTVSTFKNTELKMGRTKESKTIGLIPIDIDLIAWNNEIVHEDYHRFEFVSQCVNQLL